MAESLQFTVANRSIRMQAQEPAFGHTKQPAVVLLHGAGGNLDFWLSSFGPLLQRAGISLYAPHCFERTGTVRADMATIVDGVHVPQWIEAISHALTVVRKRPGVDDRKIALLGISLGAFLGLAYAATESAGTRAEGPPHLRAMVEISGGLVEPYRSLASPTFPPTLLLHGAKDSVVPVSHARDLSARLMELNVAHRSEILPGEGHWFSTAAAPRLLMALSGFLQEHLQLTSASARPL